jgi:hypothetical protein
LFLFTKPATPFFTLIYPTQKTPPFGTWQHKTTPWDLISMVLFIVILRTTPRLQILSFSMQFPVGFHDSLALFF